MKTYSYRSVWHDGGCVVFRSDGARLPFKGRRLTSEECNRLGNDLPKQPGALWKRFSKA